MSDPVVYSRIGIARIANIQRIIINKSTCLNCRVWIGMRPTFVAWLPSSGVKWLILINL